LMRSHPSSRGGEYQHLRPFSCASNSPEARVQFLHIFARRSSFKVS
jgi:hypothetical protein